MPVRIETYGIYGPQAVKLIKQIGKKIQEAEKKYFPLFISSRVSLWQFKTAMLSMLGVAPQKTSSVLEGLFNFHAQEAEMLLQKLCDINNFLINL